MGLSRNSGVKNMSYNNLVFTYGSLKKGYHNHFFLERAHLLQEAVTSDAAYQMHATDGLFPLVVSGDKKIAGELYVMDDATLAELDRLETNGIAYNRIQIKLSGVDAFAWMYMFNEDLPLLPADGVEFLVGEEKGVQTWLRPEDYFHFED